MSATILQFTPKATVSDLNVDCGLDISAPDKRGFVIVDACVSMSLAIEFMTLVAEYSERETPACPAARIRSHDRETFCFEMTEPVPGGNVLIDACVPQALALEFRDIRANLATAA
jgi:hypothetical protein